MRLKARTLAHCFREAWRNLGRNGLMSLASAGTVTVSLMILGAFFLFLVNFNHMAEEALENAKMRVVLSDDASFESIEQVRSWLLAHEGVGGIKFVSREEALRRLEDMTGKNEGLFTEDDAEVLPQSFDVVLVRDSKPDMLANGLKRLPAVSQVLYGRDFFRKMMVLVRLAWIGGIGILAVVAFAILFIITNTIRLTVFARRREIEIMGLVGASEWYIRWPFIFEGIVIGLSGALVSGLILSRGYYFLVKKLAVVAPFLHLLQHRQVNAYLTWALLGVGALFGLAGSAISIKRFLRAS